MCGPTREMGEAAAAAATDGPVKEGTVGAGTGASVGKVFGIAQAMKGGVGSYTVALGGPNAKVLVSALAVVNAVGDVRYRKREDSRGNPHVDAITRISQ